MATVYSGWSDTWKPSGSSVNKQYRARLDYSYSYNETTFYCSAITYFNLNSSVTVESSYNSASMSATSQATATGTFATVFEQGNTVVAVSTRNYSWARTTYAYSVTISGSVRSTKKDWDGYWMTASVTLTIPALASYTVSYNANTGAGAPGAQTKWYGQTLYLQPATANPSKPGYTFTGWNTAADGSGTSYSPGAAYTANAGMTLYAQWRKNQYEVSYNKNDSAATGTMENSIFTYDEPGNLQINLFKKENYLFVGWALENSDIAQYTDGQEVLNLSTGSTVPLYAIWKKQYTKPDLQNSLAYRVHYINGQDVNDDTGTGFVTSVYVVPGIKEVSLGNYDTHIRTIITAFFKDSASNSWTQLGTSNTIAGVNSYTITTPTLVTFKALEGITISDNVYDIKFIADAIDRILSTDTSVNFSKTYFIYDSEHDTFSEASPVGDEDPSEEGWYEDVIKESNDIQTILPAAKFLFDANPTNNAIGLYTSALDGDGFEDTVILGVEGDVQIEYNESAGEGTLDGDITAALAVLAGEDTSLDNVPVTYIGGATLGAGAVTLPVTDWSNNSQTVGATGVRTSSITLAMPAPSSYDEYVVNNVRCTGQATDSLTFTCDFIPADDITVNIINIIIS